MNSRLSLSIYQTLADSRNMSKTTVVRNNHAEEKNLQSHNTGNDSTNSLTAQEERAILDNKKESERSGKDHVDTSHNKTPETKKNMHKKKGRKKLTGISDSIKFSQFSHSNMKNIPHEPTELMTDISEVALFVDSKLITGTTKKDRSEVMPILKSDVSAMTNKSNIEQRDLKKPYLGADLFKDLDIYQLMDASLLDNVGPCMEYIKTLGHQKKESVIEDEVTFVSPRHHIIDIGMSLFNLYSQTDTSLLCAYTRSGYLILQEDSKKSSTADQGVNSKDPMIRKICKSGFAFEDLVTEGEGPKEPVFSIVKGKINSKINLLLRCEIDAYNEEEEIYTELKCYSTLRIANSNHRKKLLRTWLQTGLCPKSNVVMGIRDPSSGILDDIKTYSRSELYHLYNNRSLRFLDKDFNYNTNIAVQWTHYCLNSINKLVHGLRDTDDDNPQGFRIVIDKKHNITLRKLKTIPAKFHIEEYTEYL